MRPPTSLRSLLRVYREEQDGNNPVALVRRRKPGCYDRRERRDIWLSVTNEAVKRLLGSVKRFNEMVGSEEAKAEVRSRGRWRIVIIWHPGGASFIAFYVSTQDKLRPRDVERILRMYAEERRRVCCVTEELAVIVYRGATVEAERMLSEWVREAPKVRMKVKADVMGVDGRRFALDKLVERVRKLIMSRVRGILRKIREAIARRVARLGVRFTKLAAYLSVTASHFGIVRNAADLIYELRSLLRWLPPDSGPPPRRLLEVLERHIAIPE